MKNLFYITLLLIGLSAITLAYGSVVVYAFTDAHLFDIQYITILLLTGFSLSYTGLKLLNK